MKKNESTTKSSTQPQIHQEQAEVSRQLNDIEKMFSIDPEWREASAVVAEIKSPAEVKLGEIFFYNAMTGATDPGDVQLIKECTGVLQKELTIKLGESQPHLLKSATEDRVNEIRKAITSLADRSKYLMDLYIEKIEEKKLKIFEQKLTLTEAKIDGKIEDKISVLPVDKEKAIRQTMGETDHILHLSDLMRYQAKQRQKVEKVAEKEPEPTDPIDKQFKKTKSGDYIS